MLSNKIFAKRKEPIFQIPSKAKTQKEIGAYVDQYVKDSIAWQEREFQKWKLENITLPLHDPSRVKQRRRQVWKWSAVSFSMLCFLVYSGILPISQRLQEILILEWLPDFWFSAPPVQNLPNTPLFFSIVALLITAPIAYAIWTIRDENAAQTLENARKDTNLKDFQRLSEWASGFHFPEDKTVSLNKQTIKNTGSPETTTETSTTTETYSPPKDAQQISRRMGAESLQVAAIYQLQAFMRGAYGEQFMKPAFHMLHSIWEGLMRPLLPPDAQVLDDDQTISVQNRIEDHHQKPIYRAVNNALIGDGGMTLRVFRDELAGLFLAGISTNGENMRPLRLAGLNFSGANISWSSLRNAKFQGIKLVEANMCGANIQGSQLLKANLLFVKAQHINMHSVCAKLITLSYAELMSADLLGADFEFATLKGSDLQQADIFEAKLRNAILTKATLPTVSHQTFLDGAKICAKTIYQNCEPNSAEAEHQRAKWLRMGAILVDSKTGEPIKPK